MNKEELIEVRASINRVVALRSLKLLAIVCSLAILILPACALIFFRDAAPLAVARPIPLRMGSDGAIYCFAPALRPDLSPWFVVQLNGTPLKTTNPVDRLPSSSSWIRCSAPDSILKAVTTSDGDIVCARISSYSGIPLTITACTPVDATTRGGPSTALVPERELSSGITNK